MHASNQAASDYPVVAQPSAVASFGHCHVSGLVMAAALALIGPPGITGDDQLYHLSSDTVMPAYSALQLQPVLPVKADTPVFDATEMAPMPITADTQQKETEAGQNRQQDDILVTARQGHAPDDPLQAVNAQSFALTQTVDRAVVEPVALVYQRVLPTSLRSAIRHFLNNLSEPVVFANFLLQHKLGKAAETAGRFAINTTIGVAGVLDIANKDPFRLPRRRNGFAYTLGFYGVKPGPFLFLPLIGPTTVRDLIGLVVDRMLLPTLLGQPFNQLSYTVPATVLNLLDRRIEFDVQLREFRDTVNPYVATRSFYLECRQAEIEALHQRRPETPVVRQNLPSLACTNRP